MAHLALALYDELLGANEAKDSNQFRRTSERYLQVMRDLDGLLAANRGFLLGKGIAEARSWGTTEQERALYEGNARSLITLWGLRDNHLHDYSRRGW